MKVATTGRVKVKVDATRGAICVGVLLVMSAGEAVAMKSVPVDLGGTPIHRPGTIIGKTLEPLGLRIPYPLTPTPARYAPAYGEHFEQIRERVR